MTDYNKVINYYQNFNEWERLNAPSGRLEFELTMNIILNALSKEDDILDLGGGPGRYTIELAKLGYDVHLADLSEDLLNEARTKVIEFYLHNVKSIQKINAVNLSAYKDESCNIVLLLGPLYHLTTIEKRQRCIKEVYRVLKPNGTVIASFIPYLSGAIGIVERFFFNPSQVDQENLLEVFKTGVFNNKSSNGFQEGYYPTSKEIIELFDSYRFKMKLLRSIRGFGYSREKQIYDLKEKDIKMYDTIIQLINETANNEAILETNGHAVYIGTKH